MVACPINSMVDSTGFFKDIVTPLELQIALTKYSLRSFLSFSLLVLTFSLLHRGAAWTGQYSTDFRDVLSDGRFAQDKVVAPGSADASTDDGVRYSTVTRGLQSTTVQP